MLWTYFIIFLLAAVPFFEVAMIVPVAIIGGLPAIPVIIISFLGNLLTVALVIIFIDWIRHWRKKKKDKKESKGHQRAERIWGKYGLTGLAFIGPFFVGSHVTALLAFTFGSTRARIMTLMTLSIAFWAILIGGATYLGFDNLVKDPDGFGFITKLLNQ